MSTSNQAADLSTSTAENMPINPPPNPTPEELVSPQSFVQSLPDHNPSGPDPPLCSICQSSESGSNNPSTPFKKLPCGHIFHRDCLLEWLQTANTCPNCRLKLAVDQDCPELMDPRWVRTGPGEWRWMVDGPFEWILRRSDDNGPTGSEDGYNSHDYGMETGIRYTMTSPENRTASQRSSDSPSSPGYGPSSPNDSPNGSPDRQTPDE